MSGAVTATFAVVAAMTAVEVFTAVAVVGAVVSGVGMVTKSKELQIAGMVLGAVGGIGGLAASAGLFAGEAAVELGTVAATDAASWAGDVAAVAPAAEFTNAAGQYTMAGLQAANMPGGAIPGVDIISEVAGTVAVPDIATEITNWSNYSATDILPDAATNMGPTGGAVTPELNPSYLDAGTPVPGTEPVPTDSAMTFNADGSPNYYNAPDGSQIAQGNGEGGTLGTANNPYADGTGANLPGTASPSSAATPPGTPSVTPTPAPAAAPADPLAAANANVSFPGGGGPLGPSGRAGGKESSIWSSISDFLDKRGTGPLLGAAIQAGGAFIAGATSSLTPAQVAALQSQATQNQAAANLADKQAQILARQYANMTGGVPGAVRTPRVTGLINSPASPPPGAVTGVPA